MPPTLRALSVRRTIDAAQRAPAMCSAVTDASIDRSTDAAQRLSLPRLATLLTPRTLEPTDGRVTRKQAHASVAPSDAVQKG
jgi:hypothetical protein